LTLFRQNACYDFWVLSHSFVPLEIAFWSQMWFWHESVRWGRPLCHKYLWVHYDWSTHHQSTSCQEISSWWV